MLTVRSKGIVLQEYIMLIGLPASGKSSWVADYVAKNPKRNFQVASSDDILEEKALLEGLDYNSSYRKNIGFAVKEMERRFKQYVKCGVNIIHDQTNLSVKSRNKHLAKVKDYKKSAIVFTLTENEWRRRFEKRRAETGKDIPDFVIEKMAAGFEHPTKKEGFNKIITIKS